MTPTALAERYIRQAARVERAPDDILTLALAMMATDYATEMAGGFDRSATLARTADAKRAEGPAHL